MRSFFDIGFEDMELEVYRDFSSSLYAAVSKIEVSTKYREDLEDIQSKLEDCYKKTMLEERVPDNSLVTQCFINGIYYYDNTSRIRVDVLKSFLELFRACSREKKNIVLSNLQTKLNSIKRYNKDEDEQVPF